VSLSDRELQVLRLLDSELSGPEIARRLVRLAEHAPHAHQAHLPKLDVTSRRAAVRRPRSAA
jgi:LuxR family maltose regulon positive regulatory protein